MIFIVVLGPFLCGCVISEVDHPAPTLASRTPFADLRARWFHSPGLSGMGVTEIFVGVNNEVFVTSNDLLFRSTDFGVSWSSCDTGRILRSPRDFAVNKAGEIFMVHAGGLARSTDHGRSFTNIRTNVSGVACDQRGNLYAGLGNGTSLSRSPNSGGSWTVSNYRSSAIRSLYVDQQNTLYVTNQDAIVQSTDSGMTWMDLFQAPGTIQVDSSGGIFVFSAGGLSTYAQVQWQSLRISQLEGRRMYDVAIGPRSALCVSTENGVFLSSNTGSSWTYAGPFDGPMQNVAVDQLGYVYTGTTEGVYRSLNPITP
jgi:ligand-binding sensor domain-containing protein